MFRFLTIFSALLLSYSALFGQSQSISGTIATSSGEPILGATVIIKDTHYGTTSGLDGEFSIDATLGQTLVISYIGYSDLVVTPKKLTDNLFVLESSSQTLDEVVVVAMGTQKRATITAAVATVGGKDINLRPVTDATSALQGNVAGLNFASAASEGGVGGELGSEIKFNIRGIGSINGSDPYVLVDGVEQSLQNVNPADIESVTVLKDASAAAVYGARAAYGVVLVTTKSGKSSEAKITYNSSVGISSPINMPKMMSSLNFASYINERRANSNLSDIFTSEIIDMMSGFIKNPYSAEYPGLGLSTDGTLWASAYENQYANTDWFDYSFKQASLRYTNNLSITGGSDSVNYYVGMGHTYQGGLIDYVEDDLDKLNLNTKINIKAKEWLKFSINNNLTLTTINRPLANQTIFYGTIANSFPNRPTVLPMESEYNIPMWNEMMYLKSTEYGETRISDAITLSATLTPLDGLEVSGEIKGRFDVNNNDFIMKTPQYIRPDGSFEQITSGGKQGYQYPGMSWKDTSWGSYTRGSAFNYYISPQISTSYVKEVGSNYFKAQVGFQSELQHNSREYLYRDDMLSDDIYSVDNANGTMNMGESRSHWSTMGYYTRLNWNYNEQYFVEVSGRYDGSSRFAPGHRWGLFPSVSVGYNIARSQGFMDRDLSISLLKVRASYGRLGNQNGAGLYDYMSTITVSSSNNAWFLPEQTNIAYTPSMVSPNLTWEKVDNANLGVDLLALNDRLSVTADIYQRTTRDMIGPAEAIPMIGGIASFDRALENNATLRNRGWELSVNWSDKLDNGFSYGVGFNLFDYKAVITEYTNPEGIIYNNHTGLSSNLGYYKGMDIGEIWGYVANDLYQSNAEINAHLANVDMSYFASNNSYLPGDLKYLDTNNDGKINPGSGTLSDHGDLTIIGNTTPRYSYGINLNVGYKGFAVSALLQGVAKRDFPLAGSTYLFGGKNYFESHLDYWTPENSDAYLPRLVEYGSTDYYKNTSYNTTRYMVDGSYMRLKNLMVSYTFDNSRLSSVGLGSLRVYITSENLFTIDNLPSQFDPETINIVNTWAGGSSASAPGLTSPVYENGNGKVYPLNKNFILGVDLSF
ncbi:MAG: TonB-dependent receptor [Rikenellaceae bacterium]